jgi:hypothetical protein
MNSEKYTGSIVWIDLLDNKTLYWTIPIDNVLLDGKSLGLCSQSCSGAIDTGTSLLTAPSDSLDVLY